MNDGRLSIDIDHDFRLKVNGDWMATISVLMSLLVCVGLLHFSRVHATLHPALSVCPSIRRSVGWSIRHTFTIFYQFCTF